MDLTIPRFPLDQLCDRALDWLTANGAGATRVVSHTVSFWVASLTGGLQAIPPALFIAVAWLLAWRAAGWRIGLLTLAGLCFLWNLGLWAPMLATLVLVVLSTLFAVLIGLPLGIVAALHRPTWRGVAPCMDVMQTMPSFVYLIPAMMVGSACGSCTFTSFCQVVQPNASAASVSSCGTCRMPSAVSLIVGGAAKMMVAKQAETAPRPKNGIAGINQTIMLSLSMVVIAAMIGAGGLGREVWSAIQRLEAGRGFQAGIAIAIVAVILDRVTQALSRRARTA